MALDCEETHTGTGRQLMYWKPGPSSSEVTELITTPLWRHATHPLLSTSVPFYLEISTFCLLFHKSRAPVMILELRRGEKIKVFMSWFFFLLSNQSELVMNAAPSQLTHPLFRWLIPKELIHMHELTINIGTKDSVCTLALWRSIRSTKGLLRGKLSVSLALGWVDAHTLR